ncbi:hypothetical protein CRG98_023997 [Punica granatum]|uniref:Uncharacterized protein n=1 Tax=Punica granatum TaxID=22663 RepID=A0A2I0JH67_PUNGR|nr:hypothetical protein CRG98_023997 [Punica granatum]
MVSKRGSCALALGLQAHDPRIEVSFRSRGAIPGYQSWSSIEGLIAQACYVRVEDTYAQSSIFADCKM